TATETIQLKPNRRARKADRRRDLNPQPPISEGASSLFRLVLNPSCAAYSSPWGANMSIESLEEALRREIADALDRVMAEPREVTLACAAAPPPQRLADEPAQPKQAPQTPNAERAHDEAVATRPARQVRNARIPVTILVAVIIAVVMM